MQDISVIQLELGNMANFNYLVIDNASKLAIVIDPCEDIDSLLAETKKAGAHIIAILLTHGHYDHVGGINPLSEKLNIPVYLSKDESALYWPKCDNLEGIASDAILPLGLSQIKAISTPGHTPGGISYLIGKNLFTGDTLFVNAIGRTDFPGGNGKILFQSLQKIKTLADDTIIWPGHNYGDVSHASLGELKKTNPYLAAE